MYKPHHHYKGENLSRSEKIERKVIELILSSKIPDSKREDSVVWELKHSSGCIQIARILAENRKLDVEIAEIIAAMHDIYVIIHGTYKNHAHLGAPIARKILEETGEFTDKEIETISTAIAHHSEKDINSHDPYIELIKDVDVFDCSLYKGAEGDYRINKSEPVYKEYVKRIEKVRKELGLSPLFVWRE